MIVPKLYFVMTLEAISWSRIWGHPMKALRLDTPSIVELAPQWERNTLLKPV